MRPLAIGAPAYAFAHYTSQERKVLSLVDYCGILMTGTVKVS